MKKIVRKTVSQTYKIKAVSLACGVPAPTLRIWESRYGAFSPQRTPTGQRAYTDEDLLKASLLKRLVDAGHAISSIANLSAPQLRDLSLVALDNHAVANGEELRYQAVSVMVVGLSLASRVEHCRSRLSDRSTKLYVGEVYPDLDSGLKGAPTSSTQVLLIHVNSLHIDTKSQVDDLIRHTGASRTILLYNFGQERVIEWIKNSGITVRREPVSESDLLDLLESVLLLDARKSASLPPASAVIPGRRYTDEGLQAIARISTNVLCECPRHVAEIISMLANFERYSHDCLNNSAEDAHLHAQLKAVAGSCRAMFERAMEAVSEHENIDLTPFRMDL